MHPSASGGTVVQLPPKAPDKVTMDRGGGPTSSRQITAQVNDLLDGVSQPARKEEVAQVTDFFDSVAISSPPSGVAARMDSNPFNVFAPVPVAPNSFATPTIAQLPIHPPTSAHVPVPHQGTVAPFGLPQGPPLPYQQQGHAPLMVNQGNAGHPGQAAQGVYSNIPPQHQPPVAYPAPPTQNVVPVFHQPPTQSPTMTGPPHTQPQLQRPPSSNLSQFDPFAKR